VVAGGEDSSDFAGTSRAPAVRVSPYRPVTTQLPRERETGSTPWPALALVAALMVGGFAVCTVRSEQRGLEALPGVERQRLLDRTLENLAMCRRSPQDGLRPFCEGQAELARRLPECDAACRSLAPPHTPSRSPSARP
jgi:hypothetical protein